MLIGVMVEVVSVIGATQREGMIVSLVASQLRDAFAQLGKDTDVPLSKFEFQQLLNDPQIIKILSESQVDVVAFLEATEITFEDIEKTGGDGMGFENFVELVLDMRGTNQVTIKDVKQQIKLIKRLMNESETKVVNMVGDEMNALRTELHAQHSERMAREAAREKEEDGDESDGDEGDDEGKKSPPEAGGEEDA